MYKKLIIHCLVLHTGRLPFAGGRREGRLRRYSFSPLLITVKTGAGSFMGAQFCESCVYPAGTGVYDTSASRYHVKTLHKMLKLHRANKR